MKTNLHHNYPSITLENIKVPPPSYDVITDKCKSCHMLLDHFCIHTQLMLLTSYLGGLLQTLLLLADNVSLLLDKRGTTSGQCVCITAAAWCTYN